MPSKAPSFFVRRGLRAERLCKAAARSRALSCLTLVIIRLFHKTEEAVRYFFNLIFYFLHPLCDVYVRNTLLHLPSPRARRPCPYRTEPRMPARTAPALGRAAAAPPCPGALSLQLCPTVCLVFPWVCSKTAPARVLNNTVKQHRVAHERVVLAQSSAALLPRLPLCCQPRQSPLPSPRDKTLHKSPFFWHVL